MSVEKAPLKPKSMLVHPDSDPWADVPTEEWNDWRWQLKHRIRDLDGLERVVVVTPSERAALSRHGRTLPLGIPPYYARLLDRVDPEDPLRKTVVPQSAEWLKMPWERDDPLGEEGHLVAPGLVHTYPNKVLFLVTDFCATYCRYCTRSRMVGAGEFLPLWEDWEQSLAYIRDHPEVTDVLLSGGDPLVLSDDRLGRLLSRLRAIDHVEIVRIGTKLPAVLPQRITSELVAVLREAHPLWMSLHFTHPRELTPEVEQACIRLADAGIPLMAQTVLLAGVNDDLQTMQRLFSGLLRIRVKPYYLHQCDAVTGSSHFKVPVERGLELVSALHGRVTGYAVPHYMIDAPGGGGKVPVSPEFIAGRDGDDLLLVNRNGALYRYPDPNSSFGASVVPLVKRDEEA